MKPYRMFQVFLVAMLLCCGNTFAQLQANFTADKQGGCSPISVAFTNTTTGASSNAVYTWDLGNGNTATSFHAGGIYKDEKTYTITLTVKDGNQSSVKTQSITVYARPTVDFSASSPKICLPTAANFIVNASPGSGNITSYYWDFGDGLTQQGFTATQLHSYAIPQKATVSLTVANNYGCTNTIQKTGVVEILPTLRATFNASQTILCSETDAVQFLNSSSGPGTLSYSWDFGDGTTSTDINPSHAFNKKGIYTVKLTVTSSEGCVVSSTQSNYINVATFKSDFTVPPLICGDGTYATFTSTSSPYTSNTSWQLDGNAFAYSNPVSYFFSSPGMHTLKLKNIFGTCPDSVTKTITVKPTPLLSGFESTVAAACGAPVTVNFKDTSAGAVKWEWNFNTLYFPSATDATTQSTSYNYLNDGTYLVRLKVSNADGCSATATKFVGITRPSVYITSSGTPVNCGSYKMKFTANSTEEITSYRWDFSDGAISTAIEPEHEFAKEGINSVQLTYVTKSGCTGTVSIGGIRVYQKPSADFTASSTTICGNTPMAFNATPQGNEVNFYWYLGDSPNPVYNYSSPYLVHKYFSDDTYTITLIAIKGGCSDTVTKKDYIKVLPPITQIGAGINTCDGTRGLVTFSQNCKKATGWTWDFGDGNTATFTTDVPSVQHTYTKTGAYKVVLASTNGQCTVKDSTIIAVLLKQSPVLTTSKAEICVESRLDIKIANLERNPKGDGVSNHYNIRRIEYGDGSLFNGSLSNTYPGFYWTTEYTGYMSLFDRSKKDIRVIIQSQYMGCYDTTNIVPLTIEGAQAGFEIVADNNCFKSPVILRDTSKSLGNTITSWQWSFGDGNIQTFNQGGTVTHTYANPGNYYVSVKVTDNGGCTSTSTNSPYVSYVTVNGPKAAFSASTLNTTITLPVYFYNYTNTYNSPNTQYKWDFGDGVTSTDINPTHAYNTPGTYKVQLIAVNPTSQCSDTISQTITVGNFRPSFTITASNLGARNCPPVLARFNNNSVGYTSITWDFGDGSSVSNVAFPSHVYETPGKYIVTLYLYGPSGLTATYIDSVLVSQPEASIRANGLEGCINHVVAFTSVTKNTSQYAWDFGDGTLSIPGDSLTTHKYTSPGVYSPALIVTQPGGCVSVASLPDKITIRPNPVIILSPAEPLMCKGTPIRLTATGGSTYSWSPATGLSDPAIAAPMASPDNTTTYTVLVKDDIGCSNTASTTVKVITPLLLTASSDTFACKGSPVQLSVSGADLYTWINDTNGLSNTQINNPVALPAASTKYTVVGADKYHCFTDTAIINVNIIPLPTVKAGPGAEILPGASVQLSAIISSDVVKWNWSPTSYLSCNGCLAPVSTPFAETKYTITVKTKEGCSASDTTVIKLICEESRVSIPSAFTPNGDTKNDVFLIKGISIVKHLIIYNRWGNKVFERSNFIAADRSTAWDGTVNGTPAPEGTYVYFAEMQCPTGGVFMRKGSVVLVR